MRFRRYLFAFALFSLVCGACSAGVPSAQVAPAKAPPTLEELKGLTYSGIPETPGPVTLQNGVWTGEPAVPGGASRPTVRLADDFLILGDLDGDGLDESVVVLTFNSGGSGVFSYLAVVSRREGKLDNIATESLGDRVQLKTASIQNQKLLASVVRSGSGDAACCPGELADLQWSFDGRKPSAPITAKTSRLSLGALAGTEWILRSWDLTESAALEPVVTLTYDAGRIAGSSGCNRYNGTATDGPATGEFSVGPLAGTRMACADTLSAVETRFIEQLSGAQTYGFMLGRLAISYRKTGGSMGTMLFQDRAALR